MSNKCPPSWSSHERRHYPEVGEDRVLGSGSGLSQGEWVGTLERCHLSSALMGEEDT